MLPKNKEIPPAEDGRPKFGRLLLVLFAAVMVIVVITLATEAYYTN